MAFITSGILGYLLGRKTTKKDGSGGGMGGVSYKGLFDVKNIDRTNIGNLQTDEGRQLRALFHEKRADDELVSDQWYMDFVSTNIHAIKYNIENEVLSVIFVNGGEYEYYGVPYDVAVDFIHANSKGEFFHTYIRGRGEQEPIYPFTKIA